MAEVSTPAHEGEQHQESDTFDEAHTLTLSEVARRRMNRKDSIVPTMGSEGALI